MDEREFWKPAIGEIMQTFRDSLVVLVPVMERARLPWRQDDAYDEWDQIATSLFDGIVLSSLRWGLEPGTFVHLQVPAYDMVYADYQALSFIECPSDLESSNGCYSVFYRFVADEAPFDKVQCYEVDKRGYKLTDEPVMRPMGGARFVFWHRHSSGQLTRYESLTIQIDGENYPNSKNNS